MCEQYVGNGDAVWGYSGKLCVKRNHEYCNGNPQHYHYPAWNRICQEKRLQGYNEEFFNYTLLGVLIMTVTPGTVSFSSINFITIVFVVLYILGHGSKSVSTSMNMPMIADCTDYEVARTGVYAPGIIGTIFSFVDKVVSSFSSTIVGFLLAGIGYTSTLPQPGDAISSDIRMITLI